MKIAFIGGVSIDDSGMRQGSLLDVSVIRDRIRGAVGLEAGFVRGRS